MAIFIGIDVGTQSTKVLAFDSTSAKVVGRGTCAYDLLSTAIPNRAEQNVSTWTNAVITAVKQATSALNSQQIKGVSVSGQQHGMVVLDSNKTPLRPAKLWCDLEAAKEAAWLSRQLGITIPAGFTAPKIKWLIDSEPDIWRATSHVCLPHDYVNYFLTDNLVMEAGDASGLGIFDIKNHRIDTKAASLIDAQLPGKFPPVVRHDKAIGHITHKARESFGWVSGDDDVAVAPGGGDNMMSAIGARALSSGTVCVSLGTSGTLFCTSNVPIWDPTGVIAPFCSSTGQWLPLVCTQNCAGVGDELAAGFGKRHEELEQGARDVPPGCDGVCVLPYLAGERTPNWPHAFGGVIGLKPGSFRAEVVYRAALEGATYSLYRGLLVLRQQVGNIRKLHVVGGGAKNELWCQIIADVCQVPVHVPAEQECAAYGACLQGAAIYNKMDVHDYVESIHFEIEKVYEPCKTYAEDYQDGYKKFVQYSNQLFDDQNTTNTTSNT